MQSIRITKAEGPIFNTTWAIYEYSFPLFEQRTIEHQKTAFESPHYHMNGYLENDVVIGLIGYWEFDTYIYIEHFAIDPKLRSGGYGSKVLTTLQQSTSKTIILEIDDVVDEISTRRLHFYQRLGFVMNPYTHMLPCYQEEDHRDFQLKILTYPTTIDAETHECFCRDLADVVMRRSEPSETY